MTKVAAVWSCYGQVVARSDGACNSSYQEPNSKIGQSSLTAGEEESGLEWGRTSRARDRKPLGNGGKRP
jgi:hypothetical protein